MTPNRSQTSGDPRTGKALYSEAMSSQQELIERFYYSGWNKNNEKEILACVSDTVRFRSAMGKRNGGAKHVVEHMKKMHSALGKHNKKIQEIVMTENKAAVRVKCSGIHKSEFFGQPGTGHEVTWCNAAFFTLKENKIVELWVLGDLDSIKNQVGAEQGATPFPNDCPKLEEAAE